MKAIHHLYPIYLSNPSSTKHSIYPNTNMPATTRSRKPTLKKTKTLPAGHRLYQGTATIGTASAKSPTWEKIRHKRRVGFFVPQKALQLSEPLLTPTTPTPRRSGPRGISVEEYLEAVSELIKKMGEEEQKVFYEAFCHLRRAQEVLMEITWSEGK